MINKILFCIFTLFYPLACVTTDSDPSDAKAAFERASKPYEDENFEIAATRLGEFRSRFPYSQYAVLAELYIANSHFEMGHYAEAGEAYKQFIRLHPKHEQLDFALYRIGDSFWQDAPDSIDREQEYTGRAIQSWEVLLKEFPRSKYAAAAKVLVEEGKNRIARSHEFIALYYCKQGLWHACAHRSLKLIDDFPTKRQMVKEALLRAADALERMLADPDQLKDDANYFRKSMSEAKISEKAQTLRQRALKL